MTKKEKIKLLIVTTKSSAAIEEGFKALIDAMPPVVPGIDKLKAEINAKFDKLWETGLEDMVALYDKLISEETIDAAIAFYSSKAGQELLEVGPKIDMGLLELGQKRTTALSKELIESLLALELSEEQMEDMGFVKVDQEEMEALRSFMQPASKQPESNTPILPIQDPTEITETDLANLDQLLDDLDKSDKGNS